jgi:PTS system mannose-specific IIC component
MIDAVRLLPLTLLGALLGADVVSFPQAMISRPIVASTLGGAITGNVMAGLLTGAVLEMLAMETLPVGASRYPEWGSASLVGGALAGAYPAMTPGAVIVGVFAGVATAWAGGWSMYALRRLNGVWAERAVPAMEMGSRRAVMSLQLRGLTADLLRGAVLTLIALLVWAPVTDHVLAHWTIGRAASHSVLAAVAAGVAGGAIWRQSHGAAGSKWYLLAGAVLGIILLVLT